MRVIDRLKQNKGISLTDVVIGVLILMLFTGVLTSAYYTIYMHNLDIRCDAIAANLAITVAEDIDKMMYEEVTEDLNSTMRERYDGIPDEYEITINVEKKYRAEDTEQLSDSIKLVKININYNILDREKTYSIQKLKIKEM